MGLLRLRKREERPEKAGAKFPETTLRLAPQADGENESDSSTHMIVFLGFAPKAGADI